MSDKPLDRFLERNASPEPRTPEQQAGDAIIGQIGEVFRTSAALMTAAERYSALHGWPAILAAASPEDQQTLAVVLAIRQLWPSLSNGELPDLHETPIEETPAE
jgi:hypothetical protein